MEAVQGVWLINFKRLNYKLVSLTNSITDMSKIEAIWVKLTNINFYICFFYRTKMFTPADTVLDYMFECMMQLNGEKVIWIGDTNFDQRNSIIQ